MMRCDRAKALTDKYLFEELSPEERESFEAHLRDCRDCQRRLAGFRRFVATLRSIPAPPVPRGFVGHVMAGARKELQQSRNPNTARSAFSRWWKRIGVSGLANAVGAAAAGLLLGAVLGQQTWQFAVSGNEVTQPLPGVDTETVYSLDYLSGVPRGSFTESYLSLTSAQNDQEF